MAPTPGSRVGSCEIVAPIGAGGMGEVWRAHDTRLGRDVAIKILPEAFSTDVDRLARFEREARTLASLNHPHIAQIFGVEESDGLPALVMELVEGEDLSDLAARGPVPVAAVIRVAEQLVDALEAAHEAGIVHRDLKPANVKLDREGAVKVLDFGLAKAVEPTTGSDVDLANSPTLTARATQAGIVIGTAAYMSPEQARGSSVDKRTDIWALGVILFEMLSGRRLFEGPTVSDTLAAVLRQEIDWDQLPGETPPALVTLIRRCLERDPKQRLRDVGDARFDLAAARDPSRDHGDGANPAGRRVTIALAAIAVVAIAAAFAGWLLRSQPAPSRPTYVSIPLPAGQRLSSRPAISRDGRRLAFVATDGVNRPQLWVRELDAAESRPLDGTEDASSPFFSPDGQWIAYYTPTLLCKVRVSGGAPVRLARSTSNYGGTWTDEGTIVFKRAWNGGLSIIDENGGGLDSLTSLENEREYAHVWPYALPGRNSILYVSWGTEFCTHLLDLDRKESRVVAPEWWRRVAYATNGYIIGASSGEILAVRLGDEGDGPEEPTTLATKVDMGGMAGDTPFDISQQGTLAYVKARDDDRWLAYVDRDGRSTRLPAAEGTYSLVRISPGARRAAVRTSEGLNVVDLERGTVTPIVPELRGRGAQSDPIWSADGRSITFGANFSGRWDIYRKASNGSGDIVTVLALPGDQQPESLAPDGTLLLRDSDPDTGIDIWLLPPGGEPRPWLATDANEGASRFSPDGRLVAYVSDVSGHDEVYLQARDDDESRTQVSVDGGQSPTWSPRGDRLYFRQGDLMMQADISTRNGIAADTPEPVFGPNWTVGSFDVMPDGERFLAVESSSDATPTRIDLLLDWPALLGEPPQR